MPHEEACPECGEVHDPDDFELSPEQFGEMIDDIDDEMEALLNIYDRIAMLSILAARTLASISPEYRADAREDMIQQIDEVTKELVVMACDA